MKETIGSVSHADALEQLKERKHRILFIDRRDQAEHFLFALKNIAKYRFNIPKKNISLYHLDYPPTDLERFIYLIQNHTGCVIHNINLTETLAIRNAITSGRLSANQIVIVKANEYSNQHGEVYAVLKKLGCLVIPKPTPDVIEEIKFLLGIS